MSTATTKQSIGPVSELEFLEAVISGNIDVVKRGINFVEHDVNAMYAPIHLAAMAGQGDCVMALISNGADVNLKSSTGSTALHFLVQYVGDNANHADVIHSMIEAGADINAADSETRTPLHLAIDMIPWTETEHIAEVLIKCGADVSIEVEPGLTALDVAKKNGYSEVVKALIEAGAQA